MIITFNDGTSLEVEVNGNSYICDEKPVFPSDLTNIEIADDRHIEFGQIVECASVDDRYWFNIIEIPESERFKMQVQANIEYIAMMADIDLEEA